MCFLLWGRGGVGFFREFSVGGWGLILNVGVMVLGFFGDDFRKCELYIRIMYYFEKIKFYDIYRFFRGRFCLF